jgi:hypothetical protein
VALALTPPAGGQLGLDPAQPPPPVGLRALKARRAPNEVISQGMQALNVTSATPDERRDVSAEAFRGGPLKSDLRRPRLERADE